MTLPFEITTWTIVLALVSALVIGISKTSVGGIAAVAVAAFAHVMPAKESTAAVLLLLIIGDLVAVRIYHKHADWGMLKRLLPSVLPGIALGALFLKFVSDSVMKTSLGVMLLGMVALQLWQRRRRPDREDRPLAHGYAIATGVAAGFTTMTANAAGAVMALYLLAARVDKARFIGTNAWFFLLVNVSKVPFSAALGLFPPSTLWLTLVLLPAVLVGTWLGRFVLRKLSQATFETFTLVASAFGAVSLLIR